MQACAGAQGQRASSFLHFGLFSSNDMVSTCRGFVFCVAVRGTEDGTCQRTALPEEMGKRNRPAMRFDSSQGAARQTQHPFLRAAAGQCPYWPTEGPTATVGQHCLCMRATWGRAHEQLASSGHVTPAGCQTYRARFKRPQADPSLLSLSLSLLE